MRSRGCDSRASTRGEFLGYAPSGKRVDWMDAALFTVGEDGRIADLWVLGDVFGLMSQLRANAEK